MRTRRQRDRASTADQSGRRDSLETPVGNRLPALDRDAVRSSGKALLGALDGGELVAKIFLQTLVELVLVEIRCQIRRVVLVRRLAVILAPKSTQRPLDPHALGQQ